MGTLRRLVRESLRRIRFLAGRERWESELDEEMRFHLDMREQRIRESSATADPGAARLAAVRRFGNTALRERGREAWIVPWLESVAQDTRLVGLGDIPCVPRRVGPGVGKLRRAAQLPGGAELRSRRPRSARIIRSASASTTMSVPIW
jgi:hypothetical protein